MSVECANDDDGGGGVEDLRLQVLMLVFSRMPASLLSGFNGFIPQHRPLHHQNAGKHCDKSNQGSA